MTPEGSLPTFGDKLRELRKRAGLTQAQLAAASGVPVGSLRNYEQSARAPYWDVMFRLAHTLGVSAEAFAPCVRKPASFAASAVDSGEPCPVENSATHQTAAL